MTVLGLSGISERGSRGSSLVVSVQRVAMGRAIVREPKLFRSMESMSLHSPILDATLRATRTRAEIRRLQRRLSVTSLYGRTRSISGAEAVMTLGDRLLVLHQRGPTRA